MDTARYRERHRMTRDKVRSSIENFIERTTSGDAKAEELAVLPGVLSVYCEFYRDKAIPGAEAAEPPLMALPPGQPLPQFPSDGLVGVKQVASFLGLSENTVWQKLRTEPGFPHPSVREHRMTRWDALKVREYRRKADTQ
jgi:predicted DNA-binding transcriptional regulator AlpA